MAPANKIAVIRCPKLKLNKKLIPQLTATRQKIAIGAHRKDMKVRFCSFIAINRYILGDVKTISSNLVMVAFNIIIKSNFV